MSAARIRRGFVDGPDGQIHYRETGDGPPLVLLHLNSATSTMYLPSMQYFGKHFRSIAMDYPGYGDSEVPNPLYTEMSQWSASVIGLLDGLGIEKAHLAGHMTGAQVAADVAANYPDRIDRMVLSDVFNWNTPERRAAHEALHVPYAASEDFPELPGIWKGARGLTQLEGQPVDYEAWSNQFLASVRLKLRFFYNPEPASAAYGIMGWDGAVPYAMTRHDVRAALAKVKAPTLILHSGAGRFIRSHESMLASTPGSTGYILPDAVSSTPSRDAERWSKPIIDFLEGRTPE
jgi:pimeloyl-ACP methyl ester carboxylesterase